MPISFDFSIPENLKDIDAGALNEDVVIQFICNTGEGGEHDPEANPDDRVRPSHACFHGKIFELGEAPVPPLDYGCRCAIRYIARPGTVAAQVIEETSDAVATDVQDARREWLDANVPEWKALAKEAKKAEDIPVLNAVLLAAKERDIANPSQIAQMVIDLLKGGK